MKQILQNLKSGDTELLDIPCPAPQRGQLLIETRLSLVSAGTERMLVEFGKAGLIEKARQQPDKVRMVLDKIKTDGLLPTVAAVRNKLDQPLPLGYCNVGTVVEVGAGVSGFQLGDRVVSNGKHAEMVVVPTNLCARVPDGVGDVDAAFVVIGAIALQGVRLAQPTLGEAFVVTGLGLIGLAAVQLLQAHGCRVLALDFDESKLALAAGLGAETLKLGEGIDPSSRAETFSRGRGVDGVLITASTSSNDPVHQAAQMCRKRGRIVLIGVAGLQLSRADFYQKEISFQVSCSYGPGRYDRMYEEKGVDYPVGFVRWTEQRNFEAVLDMIAGRRIAFSKFVSHRISFKEAQRAYDLLGSKEPVLGIVLDYGAGEPAAREALTRRSVTLAPSRAAQGSGEAVIGVLGAGNYAGQVLISAFRGTGARLKTIASSGGINAVHVGRKHGFEQGTTDVRTILEDPEINAVVICTRHDSHARFVCDALRAGKHVFVEKPLALDDLQLSEIRKTCDERAGTQQSRILSVGFNRRFAPQVVKAKELLATVGEPKAFIMTVNAGTIPADHWTQDLNEGGGRIIGEACHFIDLLRFLADSPIRDVQAVSLGSGAVELNDKVTFTLRFGDGSVGTVHYLANGHKSLAKERLEVFTAGRVLQLDNFRKLHGFGWPSFRNLNLWRQDKGQHACSNAFVSAVRAGGPPPIPLDELFEVTRVSFEVARQARAQTR